MAPYYKIITSTTSALELDPKLLETMEKANAEELKKLDERLAEAEKTEGESEISDALKARANYLTKIGDRVCANMVDEISHLSFAPILGTRSRGAETCSRKDTRPWFPDRYRSNHRADRLLLWRQ